MSAPSINSSRACASRRSTSGARSTELKRTTTSLLARTPSAEKVCPSAPCSGASQLLGNSVCSRHLRHNLPPSSSRSRLCSQASQSAESLADRASLSKCAFVKIPSMLRHLQAATVSPSRTVLAMSLTRLRDSAKLSPSDPSERTHWDASKETKPSVVSSSTN